MISYLRILRDVDSWAELSESTLWDEGDCPPELLDQMYDPRGISVYEVKDDNDLKRITTACAISWGSLKPLSFVLIPKKTADDLKLKTLQKKGNTFDEATNSLHRDIVEITGLQLIALVKAVKDIAEKKVKPKEEIILHFKELLDDQQFNKKSFFKKERTEVLKQLWDEDFIQINS